MPEVGQRLSLRLEPPGGRGITIRPTVTAAEPASMLEWFGHLGVPGFFDGRHRFDLVVIPAGTLLVHSEAFGGLLVRPLHRSLDGSTRAGFEAMNEALRRRVRESHPASCRPSWLTMAGPGSPSTVSQDPGRSGLLIIPGPGDRGHGASGTVGACVHGGYTNSATLPRS